MIMIRSVLAVSALALVATLSACSSGDASVRSAVEPASLVGTWAIDSTFESPEQPFVAFVDDGTWTASDGCNRVQGTYELGDLGALTTTSGPSTLMACDGAQLPLAVAMADYVQVSGDVLTITSSADSTITTLVRSTDPTVGPQDKPVGQWIESDIPDAPFLTLAADGSVHGSDGCNILNGAWTLADDGSIAFGPFASTLKFCEGVDTWLLTAATASVQGGVMTVQDASGEVLGQLTSQ